MHFDVSLPSSEAKDLNSLTDMIVSDPENIMKQALKITSPPLPPLSFVFYFLL